MDTEGVCLDSQRLFEHIGQRGEIIERGMRSDMAAAVEGDDPLLAEVLEYAVFGGGKRIRPLLVMLAAELCGSRDDRVVRLAIAFEYLHVATLVHDDVIDHARERRGRLSVTQKFGPTAAILAGDWLHARSMKLVGRYGGGAALDVFSGTTAAMVDGEFRQLRHLGDPRVTEEIYFQVIDKKTAALIGAACETGALFAGVTGRRRQALQRYGTYLGRAFQIIDDLLDYEGEREKTGKKIGNDYVEGKITLPLLLTLRAASAADRQALEALITGERRLEQLERVRELVFRYDGFGVARQRAEELIHRAVEGLRLFSAAENSVNRAILVSLAHYVLERDH